MGFFLKGSTSLMMDLASTLEESGFDSLWYGDRFTYWAPIPILEVWSFLSAIGARTRRVMMGSAVTDPFRRHPALLAQTIATIDQLTGGRVILGLGSGEACNIKPFGISMEKPALRLRETVQVIKGLWKATIDEQLDYTGRFFNLEKAFLQVKPLQKPHPPIYIAAAGHLTKRLVGEIGDGWISHLGSPEAYSEDLSEIKTWARRAGRNGSEIDTLKWLHIAISKDREAARMAITEPIKQGLVTTIASNPHALKGLKQNISVPAELALNQFIINKEMLETLKHAAQQIPFEAVEKCVAFGTPDDCIEKIEEFTKAGAKHIMFFDQSPQLDEALNLYRHEIIPYFKG
jgi:phthiodiolone/phenolphthiodiolone dimycocerosates ketoreductase